MARSPRDADDDLLVSADVLGSFGVTPTDIRPEPCSDDTLETALADALETPVDRTTVLRRTIVRSDRGLACAARYSRADLEGELEAVFDAIGWSLAISAARDGLELTATDPHGRSRETSFAYPETPLGTDNLPAVLWAIADDLLVGTDARFVLLSAGRDRWRAALVEASELERLRDRYGPRIEAFERPLCPEHGLEAYVPAADEAAACTSSGPDGASGSDDPWPPWALEGDAHRTVDCPSSVESLIDEAEPSARSEPNSETASGTASSDATITPSSTAGTATERSTASAPSEQSPTSAPSSEIDGFEIRGTAAISRQPSGDPESTRTVNSERDGARPSTGSNRRDRSTNADEFDALSGTSTTARVENESFGTDVDCQSEDDRYRALGAALDAGGAVSVRGLLEDDDFLPELPAVGPDETRIEFADECGPVDVPDATPAAERSGFEWVDSGSLETTRVTNG